MELSSILLGVFVGVALIIAIGILIYRRNSPTKQIRSIPMKGTVLLYLDLNLKQVKIIRTSFPFKTFFIGKEQKGWMAFSDLSKRLNLDVNFKTEIKNTLSKLEKGEERIVVELNRPVENKGVIYYTLEFLALEDETNHLINVSWHTLKVTEPHKHYHNPIIKNKIINHRYKHQGFIGLQLNSGIYHPTCRIIKRVKGLKRDKNLKFFEWDGKIIFLFFSNFPKVLNFKMNMFKHKINHKLKTKGLGLFFKGSACLQAPKIATTHTLNNTLYKLDYFITQSAMLSKNFLDGHNIMGTDLSKKYAEASKLFDQVLNTKTPKITTRPVKSYTNNRKLIDYAYLNIPNIEPKIMDMILEDKNNKDKLVNTIARAMFKNRPKDMPMLVDVNVDWILKNYGSLKNKKNIYVLNLDHKSIPPQTLARLTNLKKEKFLFAFKIYQFNNHIMTLIKKFHPKFVVISEHMHEAKGIDYFANKIDLMILNDVCKDSDTKIIHQIKNFHIPKTRAIKIGLRYYFE